MCDNKKVSEEASKHFLAAIIEEKKEPAKAKMKVSLLGVLISFLAISAVSKLGESNNSVDFEICFRNATEFCGATNCSNTIET